MISALLSACAESPTLPCGGECVGVIRHSSFRAPVLRSSLLRRMERWICFGEYHPAKNVGVPLAPVSGTPLEYLENASCVPNASSFSAHTILQQYQLVNVTFKGRKERRYKDGGRKVNTLCILLQNLGKILHT